MASKSDMRDLIEDYQAESTRRSQIVANLPAYAGAGILAAVVLKFTLISHGSTATSLALINSAGPVQVIGGVLVLLVPSLGTIAILVITSSIDFTETPKRRKLALYSYSLIALFLLSFVIHWRVFLYIIAILAAKGAIKLWRHVRAKRRSASSSEESVAEGKGGGWPTKPPSDVVLRDIWERRAAISVQLESARNESTPNPRKIGNLKEQASPLAIEYNARIAQIHAHRRSPDSVAIMSMLLIITIYVVLTSLVSDRPWLPAEQLKIKDANINVGYVVTEGEKWTTILTEKDRRLIRVNSDDLSTRLICATEKSEMKEVQTLWKVFGSPKIIYKQCPK